MSASMYVRRPPDPEPRGVYIGTDIHHRIARALFDHDGSLATGPYRIDKGDSDYYLLRGMRIMATNDDECGDLDRILALIDTHGGCELEIIR